MADHGTFTKPLLKTAVYYALTPFLPDVSIDDAPAATDEEAAQLISVLKRLRVVNHEKQARRIVRQALANQAYVERNDVTLSVTKYNARRAEILKELGLMSAKGVQLWPPTSQTLITRLGGRWSTAMETCGLAAAKDGSLGRLNARFTDSDRETALRNFFDHCEQTGITPSYSAYTRWSRDQETRVPSGASLRQVYGTWNRAVSIVRPIERLIGE
ncbi:MAG: hypothetical protein Q4P71_07665 [Actinomycetaceae bacterium]|nr:hypothetical protein [Actinomycetaceae bacterium]